MLMNLIKSLVKPLLVTRFSQKLSNLELWCLLTTYSSRTWDFQRTHYGTPEIKIQDGRDLPSWILSPKCKNTIFSKTKQFRAIVSIDNLYEVVYGLFKEPVIGPIKSKIADVDAKTLFSGKLSNLVSYNLAF